MYDSLPGEAADAAESTVLVLEEEFMHLMMTLESAARARAGQVYLVNKYASCFDFMAACDKEEKAQCVLARDIFANPFRPLTFQPSWRSATAVSLAQAIYDERAFDRLPILADALEDAGCDNADLLDHLRSPGPHVRGCWALDLILGKK